MSHRLCLRIYALLVAFLFWGGVLNSFAEEAKARERVVEVESGEGRVSLQQVNRQFAAAVVVPTYQAMVEKTSRLVQASHAFEQSPNDETLEAFERALLEARLAWAKGSAFEFGPVHSLGYGVAIDAPIDETGLDRVWSRLETVDGASVENAGSLPTALNAAQPALGGLGAVAYLLTTDSADNLLEATESNAVEDRFSWAQRRHVRDLTESVHTAASRLLSVWQVGWSGYSSYSSTLASAGGVNNAAYLSVQSGTEEIIRGLINSLDVLVGEVLPELAETAEELEMAVDATDIQLVESAVRGAQLAYQSYEMDSPARLSEVQARGLYTTRSTGLSAVVSSVDVREDQQIRESFETVIEQLSMASDLSREYSFEDQDEISMTEGASVVSALRSAESSLAMVQQLLTESVLPLAQN